MKSTSRRICSAYAMTEQGVCDVCDVRDAYLHVDALTTHGSAPATPA
jgi:hypothetical protein